MSKGSTGGRRERERERGWCPGGSTWSCVASAFWRWPFQSTVAGPIVSAHEPAMLEPELGRPLAASGELGGGFDAGPVEPPTVADPPRQAAVIVPTPMPSPAITVNPAAASGRGKAKVSSTPPAGDSKGK